MATGSTGVPGGWRAWLPSFIVGTPPAAEAKTTPTPPSGASTTGTAQRPSSDGWQSAYDFACVAKDKSYELGVYVLGFVGDQATIYRQELCDVGRSYTDLSNLFKEIHFGERIADSELTIQSLSSQIRAPSSVIIKTLIAGAVVTYLFHKVLGLARGLLVNHIPVVSTVAYLAHQCAIAAMAVGAWELIALQQALVEGDNRLEKMKVDQCIPENEALEGRVMDVLPEVVNKTLKTYRQRSFVVAFSTSWNQAINELQFAWTVPEEFGKGTPTFDGFTKYVDYFTWGLGLLGASDPVARSADDNGSTSSYVKVDGKKK